MYMRIEETPTGEPFDHGSLQPSVQTPRAPPQDAEGQPTDKIREAVAKAMNGETLLCPIAESDIGGTNHKIDACIVEEPTNSKLPVNSGVVPHEFKVAKDLDAQITVRQQIVGNAQHIMYDDPRHTFMFGVPIEDGSVSLWCFSRSHSIKALAFD